MGSCSLTSEIQNHASIRVSRNLAGKTLRKLNGTVAASSASALL
jgi:hypothetical protein